MSGRFNPIRANGAVVRQFCRAIRRVNPLPRGWFAVIAERHTRRTQHG